MDKKVVLLVEDDEDDIKLLLADIHKYFEVKVAKDKFECLNLIKNASDLPDVVLLDLYWDNPPTPELGFDILKEIRKLYPPEILPVVIFTKKAVEADALRALQEEAQDWLWKSSFPAEKVWRLSRAISRRKIDNLLNSEKRTTNYYALGFVIYGIIVTLISGLLGDKTWPFFSIVFLVLWGVAFRLFRSAKAKLKTKIAEIEIDIRNSK